LDANALLPMEQLHHARFYLRVSKPLHWPNPFLVRLIEM
jgi:hypothetical protein